MKQMGLFGAVLDPKWGGLGLSASTYAKIVMRISEVWMSLTGIFNSHLMMAMLVQKFGSEEQKKRFLPRMASGELRGGLALTEPDAGTDLSAIRTARGEGRRPLRRRTAPRPGSRNGIEGNCFAVLAQDRPEGRAAAQGPVDVHRARRARASPLRASWRRSATRASTRPSWCSTTSACRPANLIGGEGQGFYCAVERPRARPHQRRGARRRHRARRRSTDAVQLRAARARPSASRSAQHQAIQLKLGEMATRVEAARLLIEQAAQAYDDGERCDMEAGMAKYFASEAGLENALEAMRIHGAYGYSKEFPIERLVPRRAADVHRRGHQRDAAHHHRARSSSSGIPSREAERR